eukprot:gene21955-29004_t
MSYAFKRLTTYRTTPMSSSCSVQATRPSCRVRQFLRRPVRGRPLSLVVLNLTDYTANKSDLAILKQEGSTPLQAKDLKNVFGYPRDLEEKVKNVFGYPRDLDEKCTIGKVIGRGSFGVVHEGCLIATNERLAVKKVGKTLSNGTSNPRYLLKLRAEVEIMQQLGYSLDAVNLKDVFEDDESVYLVMELCEGGQLMDRIKTGDYSEKAAASIVRSMLRFVSQGFVYRDVKPENFLFHTKEPNSALKATDFGLAIQHTPDEPNLSSCSGTPAYMAPELIRGNYDEKIDIWSVGMVSYHLLTGKLPFWHGVKLSLNEKFKAILKGNIDWNSKDLEQLSPPALDFLKSMLSLTPGRRPSAAKALQHPWVEENGSAADLPFQGSVVQRLQRFSTFSRLKQMVLKIVFDQLKAERELKGANTERETFIQNAEVVFDQLKAERELKGANTERETFIQSVEELFQSIDSDGNDCIGGISCDELKDGLKGQGYDLADSEVKQLREQADQDKDGEIDLTEFMISMVDWSQMQKDRSWKKIDLDGNGFISQDELMAQLLQSGSEEFDTTEELKAADELVAQLLQSGSEEFDTTEELKAADELMAQLLQSGSEELKAAAKLMIREADANGDGKISQREFDRLLMDCTANDALHLYDPRLGSEAKGQ